ncbi:hypothetical protein [Arthrobacter sp. JCM 19049]|uniref:hypothetical protein n=1 Tax=Arthrobacter sp. JCM 19049 TaxID=1460643 RepID=UPI000B1851E5|nr:hypothetical protein [Arthrobacter sp. JCM 19049]
MASGNLAADIIHRIAVEPVTRSALAREFELAPSTISAKVNELTEAGSSLKAVPRSPVADAPASC